MAAEDVKMAEYSALAKELAAASSSSSASAKPDHSSSFKKPPSFKLLTTLYEWRGSLDGRYQTCCLDSFLAIMEQLLIRASRFSLASRGLSGTMCNCSTDGQHNCVPSQFAERPAIHKWYSELSKLRTGQDNNNTKKIREGVSRLHLSGIYTSLKGRHDLDEKATDPPASASASASGSEVCRDVLCCASIARWLI
jgi:hypothetical protein